MSEYREKGADDPDEDEQDEAVDEAGRESFPASDPPSSWSGPEEEMPGGSGG